MKSDEDFERWQQAIETADEKRRTSYQSARGDHRRADRAYADHRSVADVLDFEALNLSWERRQSQITATFGVSPIRYYQSLVRILRTREALERDPILVNSRLAEHERRVKQRAARTFAA